MYFEIWRSGNLIKRGRDILGDIEFDNELMYVPTTTIELPIWYHDYITGRDEVKVFINDKCFWGIVEDLTINKAEEILEVGLKHIVNEWTYRQISVNNAIKDKNVNIVFKGSKVVSENGKNISASEFNLLLDEVDGMTKKKYIKRAGASAWTDEGDPIEITSVDSSKVRNVPGSYDVTFKAGSLSVTVTATVKTLDAATSSTSGNVTISAVPFEISVDDVADLTDSDYIEKAFAAAWSTSSTSS